MYTCTLYDSRDSFDISKSYHIEYEIPPHRFRAIMMEFRRNKEVGENIGEFGEGFERFGYVDIVQYDAEIRRIT
ncbi:hypothetical protein [Bacillus sp. GB_SG_008]|uniref:hypothetical protein n=1 Tax=Bacillus sp. GB_SG_008 TaxID=3454627 RepID=UPI003F873EF3